MKGPRPGKADLLLDGGTVPRGARTGSGAMGSGRSVMSRISKPLLAVGLALGLLPAGAAGAGKPPSPPATCSDCTIVYSMKGSQGREDLMLMKEDGTQKTLLLAGS